MKALYKNRIEFMSGYGVTFRGKKGIKNPKAIHIEVFSDTLEADDRCLDITPDTMLLEERRRQFKAVTDIY
jgi:hypothetical protein